MKTLVKVTFLNLIILLSSAGMLLAAQGAWRSGNLNTKSQGVLRQLDFDTFQTVRACVQEQELNADSDIFEVKAAIEACIAEAGIDIEAEMDEHQATIAEGIAEKIVGDIAEHIILEAKISKHMETAESIKTCMEATGVIDFENFDPETFNLDAVREALGGCLEEAGIEIDESIIAKIEEFENSIPEDVAEEISDRIAQAIAAHAEHMQIAEGIKACMDASGAIDLENFDPETFDPVAIREALGVCLDEAGIEIDEEIVAKIEEIEALIPDSVTDHIADEIAEHIEHLQIAEDIETCVEATGVIDMENGDPQSIDVEAVEAAVDGCLTEAGIDIAAMIKAKMDEMEALISDLMDKAETVKTCMDESGIIDPETYDPETFDMDAFKETLAGCLEQVGIDVEAIIAEFEERHPELAAMIDCIEAIDFESGDPETINDQIEACLVKE